MANRVVACGNVREGSGGTGKSHNLGRGSNTGIQYRKAACDQDTAKDVGNRCAGGPCIPSNQYVPAEHGVIKDERRKGIGHERGNNLVCSPDSAVPVFLVAAHGENLSPSGG